MKCTNIYEAERTFNQCSIYLSTSGIVNGFQATSPLIQSVSNTIGIITKAMLGKSEGMLLS